MPVRANGEGWAALDVNNLVGRASAPRTVTVDRDQVARFARAVRDPRPECRDLDAARRAGHPDLLAPPTFPTTFGFPPPDLPGLEWRAAAWVHAEQEYAFYVPLHAGDSLSITTWVTSARRRRAGDVETVWIELEECGVSPAGAEAYRSRMRIVGRLGTAGPAS